PGPCERRRVVSFPGLNVSSACPRPALGGMLRAPWAICSSPLPASGGEATSIHSTRDGPRLPRPSSRPGPFAALGSCRFHACGQIAHDPPKRPRRRPHDRLWANCPRPITTPSRRAERDIGDDRRAAPIPQVERRWAMGGFILTVGQRKGGVGRSTLL